MDQLKAKEIEQELSREAQKRENQRYSSTKEEFEKLENWRAQSGIQAQSVRLK